MNSWRNNFDKYDLLILVIIIAFAGLVFGGSHLLIGFQKLIKELDTSAGVAIGAALIAFGSMWYARQSNNRSELLFMAQQKPIIDITPIAIRQNDDRPGVTTYFSLVNSSGFKAKNVRIDLKYKNDWIGEWLKADQDKKKKGTNKGVVPGELYHSAPAVQVEILEIKPGETKKEVEKGEKIGISGSFDLESVCKTDDKTYTVWVRVSWENIFGHVFDEVHKYELLCTEAQEGKSFTFIPKGIISQKESPA